MTHPTDSANILTVLSRLQEVRLLIKTADDHSDVRENLGRYGARHERQHLIETIIEMNTGMVRSIVHRVARSSITEGDDLSQEGIGALIEAAETFDPTRGTWSTWAYRKIHSAVLRALHSSDFPYLSHREFAERPAVIRARDRLEQDLGRTVHSQDAALQLSLKAEQVSRMLSGVTSTSPDFLTNELSIEDSMPETRDETVDYSSLDPRELYVLSRRSSPENAPLRELAQELAISDEAVRRVEQRAISKLRSTGPTSTPS